MPAAKQQRIVRRFAGNGIQLLLENALNVCDLLGLSAPDIVQMIDPDTSGFG